MTTNVGPQSRIHASLLESSTTRTLVGQQVHRVLVLVVVDADVTGSNREMAVATSTQARCAGLPPSRQLSGRCGQSIQICLWGSNSPGMRKPSARGVLSMSLVMRTSSRPGGRHSAAARRRAVVMSMTSAPPPGGALRRAFFAGAFEAAGFFCWRPSSPAPSWPPA